MRKLSTRKNLRGSKNRSTDEEVIGEGKKPRDKYHTVELEASSQCFPLSAMKRDKAQGDASPSMITNRRRDSGVQGVKKRARVRRAQLLHDAALSSTLWGVRVLAFPDWTPY